MKSARDVVDADLAGLRLALSSELAELAGKHVLIIGGAGFLGYYLVQAAPAANRRSGGAPIRVTVYDNYVRGVPAWLAALDGRARASTLRARTT